jgi:hypothetical protein
MSVLLKYKYYVLLLCVFSLIKTSEVFSQCGEGTHIHLSSLADEYSSWSIYCPSLTDESASLYGFDHSDYHTNFASVASFWYKVDWDYVTGYLSGLTVTENGSNGYRCPVQNHLAGGALSSRHVYGCAADVSTDANQYEQYLLGNYSGADTYKISSTAMHIAQ